LRNSSAFGRLGARNLFDDGMLVALVGSADVGHLKIQSAKKEQPLRWPDWRQLSAQTPWSQTEANNNPSSRVYKIATASALG
jgi:hypothetical protein